MTSKSQFKRKMVQAGFELPQHASLEECERCHASIWRYTSDQEEYVVEAASFEEHTCWEVLPEGASFISID